MLKINACKVTDEFVFFWDSVFSQWADCYFIDYDDCNKPMTISSEDYTKMESIVITNGTAYTSAEQYMMRQKALLFGDEETAEKIMSAKSPNMCKSLGKKVKNFSNEKWIDHRISIVTQGNYLKFSQDLELKKTLMATGDRVIAEASPYDKIWGIGLEQNGDADIIEDVTSWQGLNLLGICLMNVRSHFKLIDNVFDAWRN